MDSVEIFSSIIGSAITIIMFGLAARKSLIYRRDIQGQQTQKAELIAA